MTERIKVGDVYLELPKDLPKRLVPTMAEKSDTPEALDIPAHAYRREDPIQDYINGATVPSPSERASQSPQKPPDTMAEWIAFCGEKSTLPQNWLQYQEKKSTSCGINIYACLFGIQWFFFNKMYVNGILSVFIELAPAFAFLAPISPLRIQHLQLNDAAGITTIVCLTMLPRIAIGFWANFALYKRANREIQRIRALHLDSAMHLNVIHSAGAGAIAPVALLYFVIAVAKMLSPHL